MKQELNFLGGSRGHGLIIGPDACLTTVPCRNSPFVRTSLKVYVRAGYKNDPGGVPATINSGSLPFSFRLLSN